MSAAPLEPNRLEAFDNIISSTPATLPPVHHTSKDTGRKASRQAEELQVSSEGRYKGKQASTL